MIIHISVPGLVCGQEYVDESLFVDDYNIDPEREGALDLSIDNLSFFKDNEFDGDIIDGYSLPGFRLNPRVIYYPSSNTKLEAGLSLLRFWGADKYPCFAYQDIAEWKADGYQYGFHLLPFFRAQLQPSPQTNIVLGMIYGGSNHQLIEPLYNPELNLTADPETGVQFLYNSRLAHLDLWVNWESFTFENDNHDEAFAIGGSSAIHITNPRSFFSLSLPVQMIVAHRGGEIDTVTGNVSTLANGAAGLRMKLNFDRNIMRQVSVDVMGAGYKELGSEVMPFQKGWAFYSCLSAEIWNIKCKFAFWQSSDFINLYGNPIYGNVSSAIEGRTFWKPDVLNAGIFYEQKFGNGIHLGVQSELFYIPELIAFENSRIIKNSTSFNFSTGIYLRINPSILLKETGN